MMTDDPENTDFTKSEKIGFWIFVAILLLASSSFAVFLGDVIDKRGEISMSSNRFDLGSDIVVMYRVDHNKTDSALTNKKGNGHPEVNTILHEEIQEAIGRFKHRASKIEGVSDVEVDYYGFDGEATE